MKLIDTHAHLYADEFASDLSEVINRARQSGIEKVLLPNIDIDSIDSLKRIVCEYPSFFLPMMGLHPTSVADDWKNQLGIIHQELNATSYIAIGEIGVDLYWDKTFEEEQIQAFEEQLQWSKEKNLPVAIHSRNAFEQVIASIKRVGANSLRGVFHSFGGNVEELQLALELKNFYIGINGVVTFKNSGLAGTLMHCDTHRIVLETDAPYLSPVPYRGKRNESAYLRFILKRLSEIFGISEEEMANLTSENAIRLFGLSQYV